MNVFLPYKSFDKSVQVLDDRRLTKQILECRQIVKMIKKKKTDDTYDSPYLNHPVVKHYFDQEKWIVDYGLSACREFYYRFGKHHRYYAEFISMMSLPDKDFSPIYAEGSKHSSNSIRETNFDKVCELFKRKLISKWDTDAFPKWTKRPYPDFY